ncbi:exported protein of unknown function [Sterolibacterium denitrificans]|uniref:Uncharacterized protein n=1 Tax=Sterolibacterium denitrificans TaxID=157592 RepID=A0A7Z7HSU7_9PROT|nr:exported protein of unknown function [Sterolibacterium denitrificans]
MLRRGGGLRKSQTRSIHGSVWRRISASSSRMRWISTVFCCSSASVSWLSPSGSALRNTATERASIFRVSQSWMRAAAAMREDSAFISSYSEIGDVGMSRMVKASQQTDSQNEGRESRLFLLAARLPPECETWECENPEIRERERALIIVVAAVSLIHPALVGCRAELLAGFLQLGLCLVPDAFVIEDDLPDQTPLLGDFLFARRHRHGMGDQVIAQRSDLVFQLDHPVPVIALHGSQHVRRKYVHLLITDRGRFARHGGSSVSLDWSGESGNGRGRS